MSLDRYWIMKGFLDDTLVLKYSQNIELLRNALTVMTWGARTWKDVPADDRGSIFEPTFINGTRRLYIGAIASVGTVYFPLPHSPISTVSQNLAHLDESDDEEVLMSLLAAESREMIRDIESTKIPYDSNIVTVWAFYRNCRGAAHA